MPLTEAASDINGFQRDLSKRNNIFIICVIQRKEQSYFT